MDDKERFLLQKLAESGDLTALEKLCDFYFFDQNKQLLDQEAFEKLKHDYMKLAEAGSAHAMFVLGRMYYEGVNIPQNYTVARHWFEKAGKAGDIWALNYLGYCYYYGRDIPKDDQKAWFYFSKAASLGNHCGMYKVGDMYYSGRFVHQDFEKAYYWYKKAIGCIQKDCPEYPGIAGRIGRCLLRGEGCTADPLEALKWLQRAERGCYFFLMKGDAFAHLAFPEIKANIHLAEKQLDKAIAQTRSVVQYT